MAATLMRRVLIAYRTLGDRCGVAVSWNAIGVCLRARAMHARVGPDAQGVGPAWMEGWTMSVDEAIRFALVELRFKE